MSSAFKADLSMDRVRVPYIIYDQLLWLQYIHKRSSLTPAAHITPDPYNPTTLHLMLTKPWT